MWVKLEISPDGGLYEINHDGKVRKVQYFNDRPFYYPIEESVDSKGTRWVAIKTKTRIFTYKVDSLLQVIPNGVFHKLGVAARNKFHQAIREAIANKKRQLFEDRNIIQCGKCKKFKPATPKYFARKHSSLTGWNLKCKACMKEWRSKNKYRCRIHSNTRRSKVENLPSTLTLEQWEYALEYFNGCCAVCERQLKDLFGTHTAAQDHWIPISYKGKGNPGTVATNIVPLCHGEGGCNNSKYNRIPEEWLKEVYGSRKAKRILARIEAYFDHVRAREQTQT